MYSIVSTAALCGIESVLIQAEADVCSGMPVFDMVGELAPEVREAKERLRAAIRNTGIHLEPKRITVNLYPADIRKTGTGFDLPIALAVLAAYGMIAKEHLANTVFVGEISLNGEIHPINGILPIVLAVKKEGYSAVCVPQENVREAELVKGIRVLPARNLKQVLDMLSDVSAYSREKRAINIEETPPGTNVEKYDFGMIHGQKVLKRVCEIAAAGRHNLLLVGPPGGGKTMAAGIGDCRNIQRKRKIS